MIFYRVATNTDIPGVVEAQVIQYAMVKETPQGYWVQQVYGPSDLVDHPWRGPRRWVSKTARKRLCYPTLDEAWESYRIRRARRLSYLQRDVEIAEKAMRIEAPGGRVGKPSAQTLEAW